MEKVEERLGRTPEALISPEFPESLSYVWEVFVDLSNSRSGKSPLSYSEIKAYKELHNSTLLPKDVETIKELDNLWLKVMSTNG